MTAAGPAGKPLSETAGTTAAGTGCLVAFFSLFAIAGLAFFLPFIGLPVWRTIESRSWDEVPCTIVASAVGTVDGGETYSVDVTYEYEREGRTRRSSRYDFFEGTSSGVEGKQEVVATLPPGTRTVCWVDPADPDSAVLDRSPFPWLLIGCFPLVFVAIGVGGIYGSVFTRRRRRKAAALQAATQDGARGAVAPVAGAGEAAAPQAPAGLSEAGLAAWAPSGPVVLEPAGGRFGKLVGLTVVCLVWNGFVGLFTWLMWRDGELGERGCVTLFLLPFVAVGLVLLFSVPHQLLAQWNPRPVIDLSRTLFPGAQVVVGWRFVGAASRLRRLKVTVRGREIARYRHGTSTNTVERTFAEIALVDTTHPGQMAQGSATLTLPADTMHSFAGTNNKVVWELVVEGEIAFWPDVHDLIALHVYPREMT
jgi:hypothetical protein